MYVKSHSQLLIIKLFIDVHKVESENIGQTNKHTHTQAYTDIHTDVDIASDQHAECTAFFFSSFTAKMMSFAYLSRYECYCYCYFLLCICF